MLRNLSTNFYGFIVLKLNKDHTKKKCFFEIISFQISLRNFQFQPCCFHKNVNVTMLCYFLKEYLILLSGNLISSRFFFFLKNSTTKDTKHHKIMLNKFILKDNQIITKKTWCISLYTLLKLYIMDRETK